MPVRTAYGEETGTTGEHQGCSDFVQERIRFRRRIGATHAAHLSQLLLSMIGTATVTSDERRLELEEQLLNDDPRLKIRMNGFIGALKNRIEGKTAIEVEQDFWDRYTESLAETPINSDKGREYVQLRIEQWILR